MSICALLCFTISPPSYGLMLITSGHPTLHLGYKNNFTVLCLKIFICLSSGLGRKLAVKCQAQIYVRVRMFVVVWNPF